MPLSRGQNRLLHVARRQLHLDDDTYRTILIKLAGVETSKKLTPAGFDTVMGYFEHLGFQPLQAKGPYYGDRPGMASPLQVQLIRDLWAKWSGSSDWQALDAWLLRTFKVTSLRFVNAKIAGKAIHALRGMASRPAKDGSRRAI